MPGRTYRKTINTESGTIRVIAKMRFRNYVAIGYKCYVIGPNGISHDVGFVERHSPKDAFQIARNRYLANQCY